jgi:hypothetical protein
MNMKRTVFHLMTIASCVVLLLGLAVAQKRGARHLAKPSVIREEPATASLVLAPAECSRMVRDLILYLSHEKPDLTDDKATQNHWLSESLRKALAHRMDAYKDYAKKNPDSPEGPPSNADFIGSWDYPTSFMITGSRRYGERAIVDVTFKWGPGTEYTGDTRLTSNVFVHEDGGWKLDDIYTYRGKFVSGSSLSATFAGNDYP